MGSLTANLHSAMAMLYKPRLGPLTPDNAPSSGSTGAPEAANGSGVGAAATGAASTGASDCGAADNSNDDSYVPPKQRLRTPAELAGCRCVWLFSICMVPAQFPSPPRF